MTPIPLQPNMPMPTDYSGDPVPPKQYYLCPHCKEQSPLTKEWVGLTDEKICLIAHNTDPNDWDDLTFKKCWYEGFKAGFREAEIEHNIKG